MAILTETSFEIPTYFYLQDGEITFSYGFDYMRPPTQYGSVFYDFYLHYSKRRGLDFPLMRLSSEAVAHYIAVLFMWFVKKRYGDFVKSYTNKNFERLAKAILQEKRSYFLKPKVIVETQKNGGLRVSTYTKPQGDPFELSYNDAFADFITNNFTKELMSLYNAIPNH